MELTIFERLLLLGILPAEGDLITIRIVRKLREGLSFTEAEIAEHNIVATPDGRVNWERDQEKPVEMGAKAREKLVNALEKLDKAGKVEEKYLSLFDKFGIGLD